MVSAKRAHLFKNLKLTLEIKARTEIYIVMTPAFRTYRIQQLHTFDLREVRISTVLRFLKRYPYHSKSQLLLVLYASFRALASRLIV